MSYPVRPTVMVRVRIDFYDDYLRSAMSNHIFLFGHGPLYVDKVDNNPALTRYASIVSFPAKLQIKHS